MGNQLMPRATLENSPPTSNLACGLSPTRPSYSRQFRLKHSTELLTATIQDQNYRDLFFFYFLVMGIGSGLKLPLIDTHIGCSSRPFLICTNEKDRLFRIPFPYLVVALKGSSGSYPSIPVEVSHSLLKIPWKFNARNDAEARTKIEELCPLQGETK